MIRRIAVLTALFVSMQMVSGARPAKNQVRHAKVSVHKAQKVKASRPKAKPLVRTFRGIGVQVVDIRQVGPTSGFVKLLRGAGVSALYVKGHDGTQIGVDLGGNKKPKKHHAKHEKKHKQKPRFDQATTKLAQMCHKNRILFFVWGFNRAKHPVAEANLIVKLLHRGADGYVYDAEGCLNGRQQATAKMLKLVKDHMNRCPKCRGKLLAYQPIIHLRSYDIAWNAFQKYTSAVMPQDYWKDDYAEWRLKKGGYPKVNRPSAVINYGNWNLAPFQAKKHLAVIPTAHAYFKSVPSNELGQFFDCCHQKHYVGVLVYKAELFSSAHWAVVTQYSVMFPRVN